MDGLVKHLNLVCKQRSRIGRKIRGDSLDRRVCAVRNRKRVIHVHVRKRGKRSGKRHAVLLLARVKSDILQKEDVAVFHPIRGSRHLRPHNPARHRDLHPQQLRKALGNRPHRIRGNMLPLGPSKMRHHDRARAMLAQPLQIHGHAGNLAMDSFNRFPALNRHVCVNPNQYPLSGDIRQFSKGLQYHSALIVQKKRRFAQPKNGLSKAPTLAGRKTAHAGLFPRRRS